MASVGKYVLGQTCEVVHDKWIELDQNARAARPPPAFL